MTHSEEVGEYQLAGRRRQEELDLAPSGTWVMRSCGSPARDRGLPERSFCSLQENGLRFGAQRLPSFVCMGGAALRPGPWGLCLGPVISEVSLSCFSSFVFPDRMRSWLGPWMYPPEAHIHCRTLTTVLCHALYLKPRIPCTNGLRSILELLWVSFQLCATEDKSCC